MAQDIGRIGAVAKAGTGDLGTPLHLDDDILGAKDEDGHRVMRRPMRTTWFDRPIAELYERSPFKYYGAYLSEAIDSSRRPSAHLLDKAAGFLTSVIRSATVIHLAPAVEFPDVTNRAAVRRHLVRERSALLAEGAKRRDGFTCQVCRISFVELYGNLGRGFAEAHHIVPLASQRAGAATRLKDLVTVCANCHRMLHRMRGHAGDVGRLRKLFSARWPKTGAA
jgi:5-methylcytosine-specific restriction endonuclease McrA